MSKMLLLPSAIFPLRTSSTRDTQIAKTCPTAKALPDVPGEDGLIEKVVLSPCDAGIFAYVLNRQTSLRITRGCTPRPSKREYDPTRNASSHLCEEDRCIIRTMFQGRRCCPQGRSSGATKARVRQESL